jgi:prepilin-type N-terminal cleavage/methylation domain-containing protein
MRDEQGFTLAEVLWTITIVSILLALGVFALRNYWLEHSLVTARESAVSQMRQIQERVLSEGHPLVYGVRFHPGAAPAASDWGVVRFDPHDPSTATDDTCGQVSRETFSTGVYVSAASFQAVTSPAITALCRSSIAGAASDEFALFFARGSATSGSVTLTQPVLGKTATISVSPITGRVSSS